MPKFFVCFQELAEHGVPDGTTRRAINDWSDAGTFPAPVTLSGNRVAWRVEDLQAWRESRPRAGEPPPVLWPIRKREKGRGHPAGAAAPGRARGSRVVDGRVIRPERLAAA